MPRITLNLLNGQEAEQSKQLVVFQRQEQSPTDPQALAWRALSDLARPAGPFAYELSLDFQVTARGAAPAPLPGLGPQGGEPSLPGPFSFVAPPGAGVAHAAAGTSGAGRWAPAPDLTIHAWSGYPPGACLPATPASPAGQACTPQGCPGTLGAADAAGGNGELAQ